ncbi:MAG: hypothetical protein KDA25_11090 [Phycisphaerales bacterium]|nr:hypothetical protein [Phycisphaerales bacterium]
MTTLAVEGDVDRLAAQWARIGAAFNAAPSASTPDLERLLIETVRRAPADARLFIMAGTWLCRYGGLVARHRLRRLAIHELNRHERPVLGLLLDLVRREARTAHFNEVIAACREHADVDVAEPLFDIYRRRPALVESLRRRATAISRLWGRLCEAIVFKFDALRPARWIIRMNPSFRTRADLGGDLRCSILETLAAEPDAGASESALARACGVTRRAVHAALDHLILAGRVDAIADGRRRHIVLAGA